MPVDQNIKGQETVEMTSQINLTTNASDPPKEVQKKQPEFYPPLELEKEIDAEAIEYAKFHGITDSKLL